MGTGSAARRPRLVRAHGGDTSGHGASRSSGCRRGSVMPHPSMRGGCSWLHSERPWTTCSSMLQETPAHPSKTSSPEHPFPPDDRLRPPL